MKRFIAIWILLSAGLNVWQSIHIKKLEAKRPIVVYKADNAGAFRIRKLTPRECWRLQGFPDWAFDKAQEVNSNSQLYKQAGNSVTVNVIAAIAKELS